MDQTIANILKVASNNPDYQQIANYLMSRRSYPEIAYMNKPSSNYGTFTTQGMFGTANIPQRGIVSLNRNASTVNPDMVAPTLTHELTHAAETQLYRQYNELKAKSNKSDIERQFMENFDKILGSKVTEQASAIQPEYTKNRSAYRTRGDEALAFALENVNYPNAPSDNSAPAHIDPTIATQLMLLLEQAQRVQNQQPASQGR
jgi:hypothetical protein